MVQYRKTNYVVEADILTVNGEPHRETEPIRYCDDFVCRFQNRYEAEVFKQRMEERFRKFRLELAEEKTKILEFGRFARQNRKARGKGKPDTVDFLWETAF